MPLASCSKSADLSLGTGDGGGGNGVNYKLYEAYIVDPANLQAYKSHLKPIFDNLNHGFSNYGEDSRVNVEAPGWSTNLFYKTWYLAPVRTETISKDVLGISFTDHQSQQIAFQDERAVWIDSAYFENMALEEQARLILHEVVMAIYFIKFYSFSELCQKGIVNFDHESTPAGCSPAKALDEGLPHQTKRPLNASDYEHIRRITDWIYRNGTSVQIDELYGQLYKENFDPRFFSPMENGSNQGSEIEFSSLLNLLKESELLNKLPTNCVFFGLK